MGIDSRISRSLSEGCPKRPRRMEFLDYIVLYTVSAIVICVMQQKVVVSFCIVYKIGTGYLTEGSLYDRVLMLRSFAQF